MSSLKRAILSVVVLGILLSVFCGSGDALAAVPWWRVTTISAPASPNSSEAQIVLDVSNLGDATAGGVLVENLVSGENPITVVDKLPTGVTATVVHPEGGGGPLGRGAPRQFTSLAKCAIAGQTVTCGYGIPMRPYEHIVIAINVKVEPGAGNGLNEVSVSGGGAAAVLSRRALAVEGPPSPYGVETYELTPEEEGGLPATQAGSHPFQLTTTLIFNTQAVTVTDNEFANESLTETQPVAMTKDLHFNLPAGLIGNPTPIPKCSILEFSEIFKGTGECPNNTVVGVATPIFGSLDKATRAPEVLSQPLFNLEPSVGEPAKFGFQTPAGPVILNTSVRTGGDYGVVVTVPDITENIEFIGNQVTFWGVPGDSRHDNTRGLRCIAEDESALVGGPEPSCSLDEKAQPFLIMPTSCSGPLHTTVEADSWSQIGKFTDPFGYTFQNSTGEQTSQDGCNRLSFEPSINVAPDGQQGSTPSGLTVGVHVAQEGGLNPTGLADSAVKDTTVALPTGVGLNPAGADGLSSCGLGQVGLESPSEQECPESSKVGTVEITSPLLPNPLSAPCILLTER